MSDGIGNGAIMIDLPWPLCPRARQLLSGLLLCPFLSRDFLPISVMTITTAAAQASLPLFCPLTCPAWGPPTSQSQLKMSAAASLQAVLLRDFP